MNDKKYGLIILLPGMQGDWGVTRKAKVKISEKSLHYQYQGEDTEWILKNTVCREGDSEP
jgi:hypothetical protein